MITRHSHGVTLEMLSHLNKPKKFGNFPNFPDPPPPHSLEISEILGFFLSKPSKMDISKYHVSLSFTTLLYIFVSDSESNRCHSTIQNTHTQKVKFLENFQTF